jgi:hypothetical protein
MSIFTEIKVRCPVCGADNDFSAVRSVNADRRADLRAAILDETFQRTTCTTCAASFRVDPDFAYVNADRGQWIAARPLVRLVDWKEQEQGAAETFHRVYGSGASAAVQAIGKKVRPRITFGWAALREKLVIVAHDLDDVSIELAKAAVIRGSVEAPIGSNTELRLLGVDASDRSLVFGWLQSSDEAEGSKLRLQRGVYDEIRADANGDWADLRAGVDAGLFVDLNRMMLAEA